MALDDNSLERIEEKGIRAYGNRYQEDSSVLWTSLQSKKKSYQKPSNEQLKAQADELTNLHMNMQRDRENPLVPATNVSQSKVWRSVNSNTFFNTHPQKVAEGLLSLKKGDNVIMFDMETLGTFKKSSRDVLDWYTPTEIAFVNSIYDPDYVDPVTKQRQILRVDPRADKKSLLVKPTKSVYDSLQTLIGDLKKTKGVAWQSFSDDQRRTLSDLILYGIKNPDELFTERNGITYVNNQMRQNLPLTGSIINDPTSIRRMEMGLSHLWEKGNDISKVALEFNSMVQEISSRTKQDIKLGGYNIHAFDIPVFMDTIDNGIAKHAKNGDSTVIKALQTLKSTVEKVQHVDVYAGINVLYSDGLKRFGMNKKLENLAGNLGIDKILEGRYGRKLSHFGAYDAEATVELFNQMLLGKNGTDSMHRAIEDIRKGTQPGWNLKSMQIGDRFFAHSGVRGSTDHPFDAVYRMVDGKFQLAYDLPGQGNQNPIYRNSVYEVFGQYENLNLGGVNHHGLMLKNTDDGLYHFIARRNMDDLQDTVHKSLSYLGPNGKVDPTLHEATNRDRALRHYGRMFSEDGGIRTIESTYRGLDALQEGRRLGLKTEDGSLQAYVRKAAGFTRNNEVVPATEEFYRNLTYLEGRLTTERDQTLGFVNALKSDRNIGKDYGAQGVALRNYRRMMDETFGTNTRAMPVGGYGAKPFNIEGETKYVTLNDTQSIKGQLRALVTDGHTGTPSNHIVKSRLLSMVNQIKASGGTAHMLGTGGHTPGISVEELNQLKTSIINLGDKESYNSIIEHMAGVMTTISRRNSSFGLGTINIEDPTSVVKSRLDAINKGSDKLSHIMDKAIMAAYPYKGSGFIGNRIDPSGNPAFASMLDTHNKSLQDIMVKSRIIDPNGKPLTSIAPAAPIEEKLSTLARAFTNNDMEVAFLYHGKKKGLVMAIANKKDAETIFKLSPNEIIEHNKVAAVNMPILQPDGTISLPGQKRIARTSIMKDRQGQYYVGTGFDDVMNSLSMSAKRVSDMIAGGDALSARSWMNSNVRKTMQNLSLNPNLNDKDLFLVDGTSKAAIWARGGAIDVSAVAEDWFRQFHITKDGQQRANVIAKEASRKYTRFVDQMSFDERMQFQRHVDGYLKNKYNIDTNTDSIKDTYVAQYLRSQRDIRELTPFGFYNPMARENIMKSVNYLSMDEDSVREKLRKGLAATGKYTPEQLEKEVDRRMVRRFTTSKAEEVMSGELGYLNVRAAYMNDKQLADLAKKHGLDPTRLSTHEGMFLIADDIANAFEVKRDKYIALGEEMKLSPEIEKLFKDQLGSFDRNQTTSLDTMVKLTDILSPENGEYTVGKMTIDGHTSRAFYNDHQKDVFVKGWDADRQALLLEKREILGDSGKYITDAGDRITAIRVGRDVFEKLGIKADIVLEPMAPKRRQWGSELYKSVNLILDEALRQSETLTAGKLTNQEILSEVMNLAKEHFNIQDGITIVDGKLVMDSRFGTHEGAALSGHNIHRFLQDADKRLGTNFASGDIVYGQVGLGAANVYNWENSIGATLDGNDGLVRWGIKERDMIQSRLNRLSADGTIGYNAQVGDRVIRKTHTGEWLNRHMDSIARVQNRDVEQFTRGVMDAIRTTKTQKIKENDIVIRTRGTSFAADDRDGIRTARMVDGHVEISANAVYDLPTQTQVGQRFTAQEYSKTIVNIGDLDIKRVMENGQVKDLPGKNPVQALLDKAGGSFLFELPEEGMGYVRFVNEPLNMNSPSPVTGKLQKSQMDIWRRTMEYRKNGGDEARAKLLNAVEEYKNLLPHVLGSSREGSVSKRLMSAEMDMAGRFRIQTVNPLARGSYEESTAYVSRGRMAELIQGSEEKIAKAVKLKLGDIPKDAPDRAAQIQNKVLAHIEKEGLYGFVGRYPTINEDTIQVMKMAIDPTMKDTFNPGKGEIGHEIVGNREVRITAGTEVRLKADNDGDFASLVLAHYKRGSANIHNEMKSIWDADSERMKEFASKIYSDIEEKMGKDASGVTVGKIMTANEGPMSELKDKFFEEWLPRVSAMDSRETLEARLGKSYIGQIDNLRYKLGNLADATYGIVEKAGISGYEASVLTERKAHIQEFGRIFSQDLISSKKFNVRDIQDELGKQLGRKATDEDITQILDQRVGALKMMTDAISNPNAEGMQNFHRANSILGVFSDKKTLTQEFGLSTMLDTISELHTLNGNDKKVLSNPYLLLGVSGGPNLTATANLLNGQGGDVVPTTFVKSLAAVDPEFNEVFQSHSKYYENSVLNNLNRMISPESDTLGNMMLEGEAKPLSREMIGESASSKPATNRLSDVVGELMGGMPKGGAAGFKTIQAAAAVFGGLWAASALTRSGPTPEETVRGKDGVIQDAAPHGSAMGIMKNGPTARVTPNQSGEQINISISSKDASRMSEQDISALVHSELSAMMPMQLNMNMNVTDNTQNLDRQYMQGLVSQAITTGRIL